MSSPGAGRLARHLPLLWAVVLVALLLGPALLPGYVLSYDMVFVPRLALRSDFLDGGTALPRAVPSDAAVAVLDNLVPGMLLQKLALAGPLLAAATGCARLAGPGTVARLTTVSLAVWNPFVLERLGIGHWTVLVAYGCLPWVVLAARTVRRARRLPGSLLWLLPLGSLSASAGLVTGVALLVCAAPVRGPGRAGVWARLVGLAVAANAPWLVVGLLRSEAALPGSAATAVFGAHGEGLLPAPLAVLGLGGIWNTQVVPDSRQGWLAVVGLVAYGALALAGAARWWHRAGTSEAARLTLCWAVGVAVALASWALPGPLDVLAREVPGGGLLRDGSRSLALCLPAYTGVLSAGAERLADAVRAFRPALVAGAVAAALLPVMLLPDGAWGLAGALRPVRFPESWAVARAVVDPGRGDVLLLPWSAYRAPAWNQGRTVIDPLGRYLRPDYLAADGLSVSGRLLAGEDPRGPQVEAALALPDPDTRARRLAAMGVAYVAVERGGAPAPPVAGVPLVSAEDLEVLRLDAPERRPGPGAGAAVLIAIAWAAWAGLWALAALWSLRRILPTGARSRGGTV